MNNFFKTLALMVLLGAGQQAMAQNFITQWNLATAGFGPTQLSFETATSGTVNYTWQEISPGSATGSGSWSVSPLTISGLPPGATIRLQIEPTNFQRIIINNGADRNRLTLVEQWGSVAWSSMSQAFYGCANLQVTATDVPNLSGVADMSYMFFDCSNLNSPVNIGSWNTAAVTNMSEMFVNAFAFNQNIGAWNTGAVTNMASMFLTAVAFNQNIASWNIGAVTNMSSMFRQATAFNQNLGAWTFNPAVDLSNMLDNSGMNCNNYSASLIAWSGNPTTPNGRTLGAIQRQYGTNAVAARTNLTTKGWTITGDLPSGSSCVLVNNNFVTVWNLATAGSGSTQLSFGTATSGNVNYTWQQLPTGASGSSFWNGSTLTITGLPTGASIRLEIEPTNFQRIIINNGADRNRLTLVENWGSTAWTSMQLAFRNCANMQVTATDVPNLSGVSNMSGMFSGCSVLNSPSNIGSWNTSVVTDMSSLFFSASAFNQNISSWNTAAVANMSNMFGDAAAFNQDIGVWNTSSVTNMAAMFAGAITFNRNIGAWNTAAVTNMNSMFFSAYVFNQNIGGWNTAAVTNMSSIFGYAYAFNQNIGTWNTSAVTNMSRMFEDAFNFNQNIGTWNTSTVTTMRGMFIDAYDFNQNIGTWNTSAVTDMSRMFDFATAFNQNIGSWNTAAVTNMSGMFADASAFNQNIGAWSLNPGVNLTGMLNNSNMNCSNYSATLIGWSANPSTPDGRTLGASGRQYGTNAVAARTNLDVTKNWTITGDTPSGSVCLVPSVNFITVWNLAIPGSSTTELSFETATSGLVNYTWQEISPGSASGSDSWSGATLTITGLPPGATIRVEIEPTNFQRISINYGFDRSRLTLVENWGSTNWTSMQRAFIGCDNLQIVATDVPNLSGVADMSLMFYDCTNLNSPGNINTWNTSAVTDMSNMFQNASAFNQNIGAWNTAAVTNMRGMFWEASAFNQNIGAWNTAAVTTMNSMFFRASAFNQNIGTWNTAAVTNMRDMFYGASAFNQDISAWSTDAVTTMDSMFADAIAFNQNIAGWNTAAVTDMDGMFNQAIAFNQNIGAWTLNPGVSMGSMLNNCGMDCNNYSGTLIGWDANPSTPAGRSLAADGRQYGTNAVAARTNLTTTKGWTILGDIPSGTDCTFSTLPTITSFTPTSGPVGTTVTITGTNFDTTQSNNTVTFNGTLAYVAASTATSITTIVPPGTTTGPIQVTVSGNTATSATDFTIEPFSCLTGPRTGGELDATFNPLVQTSVTFTAVEIQSTGQSIVATPMVTIAGTTYEGIIRFNADGSLDAGFTNSLLDPSTQQLIVLPDNKIIAVKNGEPTTYISRLNANGTLDASFTGPSYDNTSFYDIIIGALALQSDGKLLYTSTNTFDFVDELVRINVDGSPDPSFSAPSDLDATVIKQQTDGKILLAGPFGVVRLDEFGTEDPSFSAITSLDGVVNDFVIQPDGKIILIGTFTTIAGVPSRNIARLNSDGSIDLSFKAGNGFSLYMNSQPNIIKLQSNGSLIVAGEFTSYNDESRNRLLVLNSDGSLECSFNPLAGPDNSLSDVAIQADGKILIVGALTNYEGTTRNAFARVNGIATSCVPASERAALIALYNSTNGASWANNTNWLSADESLWYGVGVTGCQITELSLYNNNLTGSLPATINDLANLKSIDIRSNQVSGVIPTSLGSITSLQSVILDQNQLTGTIPTSIYNLVDLKTLELGANQLSGTISASISNLTKLEALGLSSNQFTGTLPTELGNLTMLTRLQLAVNQFTGNLPASIGNLVNLNSFSVFNNQLTGTVPASLSNLVNLTGLGLSVNQFTGDVPAGIGLIPNLNDVSLRDNDFTSIPTFVSTAFTDLLVYGNKLHFGHLESNIGKTGFIYSPQDNLPGGSASACEGSTLTINFSTPGTANQYQWYKDALLIPGATSSSFTKSNVIAADAGNYSVRVTNTLVTGLTLTSDPFVVTVSALPAAPAAPAVNACSGNTATLTASGGTNGQYRWYTVASGGTPLSGEVNSTYTTPVITSTTTYYVAINNGCESTRTSVTATIQSCNQPPAIATTTVQATVNGNVTVPLTTLLSDPDNNLDLSTLRVVVQPLSGALASIDAQYNLILDYTGISFSGTEKLTIEVCDLLGACSQKELAIEVEGDIIVFNGISPNNDVQNDFFKIQNIELIPDTQENKVTIYNRWGSIVFEVSNYNNTTHVFRGLNDNGNELPSGTYFYKIEFMDSDKRPTQKGYLSLKR